MKTRATQRPPDAPPADLEWKTFAAEVKVVDEASGIVEMFVAGIGNVDDGGDVFEPGAFEESLRMRKPKGVSDHDWSRRVAKTLEASEVKAGSSGLPAKMRAAGAGGLRLKAQYNLATQMGRDAFENIRFFGEEQEWSVGYVAEEATRDEDGIRHITKAGLYEFSDVLFGMNPITATVGVKDALAGAGVDVNAGEVEGIVRAALADLLAGKAALASHSTATDDGAWDGPAAKKNLPNSRAALRAANAWVDPDGDDEKKSSYKFIHHFVGSDGKVGAASTKAASTGIGVLNGGRGGTVIPAADRAGVYRHLARHLKDAGVEEPPALKDLKTLNPSDAAAAELEQIGEVKHLDAEGSLEERRDRVGAAVQGWAERYRNTDGSMSAWVYPVATFDDYVVVLIEDAQGMSYWQFAYSIDDQGTVTLGEPVEVEVETTIVEKALAAKASATEREAAGEAAGSHVGDEAAASRVESSPASSEPIRALTDALEALGRQPLDDTIRVSLAQTGMRLVELAHPETQSFDYDNGKITWQRGDWKQITDHRGATAPPLTEKDLFEFELLKLDG
jgi:phage head maturation protease